MKGVTLQQHLESIRVMVKQKTGRSMQEKDVEYTDKNGKVRVRKGCSPIRECVVVINEDTWLKALFRFTQMVETRTMLIPEPAVVAAITEIALEIMKPT